MNIHEYQAKELLKNNNVPVPYGEMIDISMKAIETAQRVTEKTGKEGWVVKAQIHAGGRGKGGGVKVAKTLKETEQFTQDILGMQLVTPQTGPEGKKVHKVLIEQNIYYKGENKPQEFYMSILLNRSKGRNSIIYSTEGGMDIEAVAAETPHLIFNEEVHPTFGLLPFQARRIAFNLGLKAKALQRMAEFVIKLYDAYIKMDATLVEINPVFKTSDNLIIAADAKVNLDDNAMFRHSSHFDLRDPLEEDSAETEALKHHLNFIKLDGNVGCMVNGAGLAMATMDTIKLYGGSPANFLDVGGTANADTVKAGLNIILKDPNVKTILINIFGGIVRCDRVARGIVEAYKSIGTIEVPIIIRLQGTNAEEAKRIIDDSNLQVYTAITLKEAANLVKEVINRKL